MSIGARIKAVRESSGLGQEAFATRLGFTRRSLHSWEKDLASPPVQVLAKIRTEFDVDPEWVLMGSDLKPVRHYSTIDWGFYDETIRDLISICGEVRLVLNKEQLERLGRIEFANGSDLKGKDRARVREYLRTFALER
ncbi:helix-turn-helix domain-containing protein [Novosphingobium mangrovi (ex Huang et al. 2023)]|uniref:Helix-turn-helix domain-containing protein n=1 Tax=Novosphingobium mangrovi (ex Huang et al. 2023) TaxID=2976432 RepID=A0ABT2I6H6_9SPHN|nr:helix-turn-helix transcriptional regulator [Novosphingobium mangrovi (ex Huang et al. 2023)]MCT2400415.1 helix-turn-helix domain-containing protein [Novosphingobium mangrovi (ex Huang et al. 2023)]